MKTSNKHGNYAKIDPKKRIEPLNCTNTITANQKQEGDLVPKPPPKNAAFAKKCVDENHK